MRKIILPILSLLCCGLSTASMAEESTLKEGAKKIGQETGVVVHKVGEGGKQVGKTVAKTAVEVGHATRDTAKVVGKKVAATAVEVGHATRDGAKELAHKVKTGASSGAASSSSAQPHK